MTSSNALSMQSSQSDTARASQRQSFPTSFQPNKAEQDVIQRVQNGEIEAFYELVRPHERGVFLAALSLVKNEADAEDVAQEAILSTWLIQIAINEAKMKLRKDRRHLYESLEEGPRSDDGEYMPKDYADWREIPSEALEQKELRVALIKALNSLPEKYRIVLVLRDVQQLSIAETSQALGLSEANVKTRLSRARLQMRDALAPGLTGLWLK